MAEPLPLIIGHARSRWMIGGDAPVPDHSLTAGQDAGEADLRLLAVAGQYQRLCQTALPPPMEVRDALPMAPLPLLPDNLRPLARRVLLEKGEQAPLRLATFAARRGYVLHPADWMPPPGADLPAAYRPWQLWQAGKKSDPPLTAETWLDHGKADRLARFTALRRSDPQAARALLAAQAAAVSAEERVALVEVLGEGLGGDDLAVLQDLVSDRSERVQRSARNLLARLGQSGDDPLAKDAAQMFELATVGLLRRRKVLRLLPKVKEAQLRSLVQILPNVSLAALAAAHGLSAMEVVELWTPEAVPPQVHIALAAMIAQSAGDAEATSWWQRHQNVPEVGMLVFPHLFARLTAADQQAALLWLISQRGLEASADILAYGGVAVPAPVSAALTAERRVLSELVGRSRDATPQKAASARADAQRLATTLAALGLLLTDRDAALVLQTVTDAGIHPADPQLDCLTLNAALKGS